MKNELKKTTPETNKAEPKASWSKLVYHSSDPAWAQTYNVEVRALPGKDFKQLQVTFKVTGPIPDLSLPVESPETRMKRNQVLWQHTCFEIFAGSHSSTNYFEWNLASSLEWGHFQFRNYREVSADPLSFDSGIEDIKFSKSASNLELNVWIGIEKIQQLWKDLHEASHQKPSLKLGLTCILENKKGEKSFWALKHPAEKADFHHSEGFAINFP